MSETLPHNPEKFVALRAGRETSEHARTVLAQMGGGGLFGSVLLLSTVVELPVPVMITALVCAALIVIAPTLSYITARADVKRCILESHGHPANAVLPGSIHADPTLTSQDTTGLGFRGDEA